MANPEHVDILRQGVEVWNARRKKNLEAPDLSKANLSGTSLGGADLNLSRTNLAEANISHVSLNNVCIVGPNFCVDHHKEIDFQIAVNRVNFGLDTFHGVYSMKTNLTYANLAGANLINAQLVGVDFSGANLRDTNVGGAVVGWGTTFGDVDLSRVKGLETVEHVGPSIMGIDTIYRSGDNIPEIFLKGVGIDDTFITYMRSLVGKPIEYNSCFISYSSKDEDFAKRLYADLQNSNVRCWYAPEHMKTGDRMRPRIYEQIWFNDKLLLVLSESSVASEWVDYEVETALTRERKEKRDILFPIRIDDAVEKSKASWAVHIQDTRHIGDFTRWKEYDEYQKGLSRLLRGLKQEAIPDTIESDAHKVKSRVLAGK